MALSGFKKLFRPAVIQALGNAFLAAQGGNAFLASQSGQNDADLFLSRVMLAGFTAQSKSRN